MNNSAADLASALPPDSPPGSPRPDSALGGVPASTPEGYSVSLDVFEGPLDLLLHLVKKHELEIVDIPISFITEKYLEYLDLMTSLDVDVAGEYLLMAATLAYIKSRELLPPDPTAESDETLDELLEEIDPRAELIRRLLEYQKYRQAAEHLGDRPVMGRNVWTRGGRMMSVLGEGVDRDSMAPIAEFPVTKLLSALERILKRARITVAHTVEIDRLSVSHRISQLAGRLDREGRFALSTCFTFLEKSVTAAQAKHDIVVTFLAILEMAKLRLVKLSQPFAGDDTFEEEEIFICCAGDNVTARLAELTPADDQYA